LATSGEMTFALQNVFVSAAARAAEESLSGLKVGLQILLTVSIYVDGCERSFSKMRLIMTSTKTESRSTNLAILSIERQTVEQVDFTKVIENVAAVKSRKLLI